MTNLVVNSYHLHSFLLLRLFLALCLFSCLNLRCTACRLFCLVLYN